MIVATSLLTMQKINLRNPVKNQMQISQYLSKTHNQENYMKLYLKSIVIALVFVNLFIQANACNCVGEISVLEEIKRSDVVFMGEVISQMEFGIRESLTNIEFKNKRVTLKVYYSYKGHLKSDTVSIITGMGSGDCGYIFKTGHIYIIYANYETKYFNFCEKIDRFLYTDSCKRTCELNYDELNEIHKYRRPHRVIRN